jgi:hypothetical protein
MNNAANEVGAIPLQETEVDVWQQIADMAKSLGEKSRAGLPPTQQDLATMRHLIDRARGHHDNTS